ncbi:cytochrome P450 [Schizopora paradoxa]|uniref:Cytochrome P450 n=1 Tax=Schizopora paradoxa TaxID=27342 RepID=A0A0H2RZH8_9AGAM|nr:cytochrome P450 [Schizopora paradoxa]
MASNHLTTFLSFSVILFISYVAKRIYEVYFSTHGVNKELPRLITPFPSLSFPSVAIPLVPSLNHYGICVTWKNRKSLYSNAPLKTFVQTPLIYGESFVYTSSVAAFRQVYGLNSVFEKDPNSTGNSDICLFGPNVIGAVGEDWKRHRRIAAPSFNRNTYRAVWDTTTKVYEDMVANEGWETIHRTGIVKANMITHKLALFIIASVGFGLPMAWEEPIKTDKGKMSLQSMIFEVSTHVIERARIPSLLYVSGHPALKRLEEAYSTFDRLMHERIKEREEELIVLRSTPGVTDEEIADTMRDVFGCLVNARMSEGKLSMSDEEIISNCLAFMFAGHETTANTLAGALGLLAIYPETQDFIFREIKDVLGNREPAFEDYDALVAVQACFFEALRIYPVSFLMLRHATEDTMLNIPRTDDPSVVETIRIKKGTNLVGDLVGLSYDPQVFPDPEEFNPRRWLEKIPATSAGSSLDQRQADEVNLSGSASTLDGFLGFSFGPRTCIGHKFAKIETVCFLANLLRSWRIEPVLEDGETNAEWRARVLEPHFGLTLMFDDVPVRFVRRSN